MITPEYRLETLRKLQKLISTAQALVKETRNKDPATRVVFSWYQEQLAGSALVNIDLSSKSKVTWITMLLTLFGGPFCVPELACPHSLGGVALFCVCHSWCGRRNVENQPTHYLHIADAHSRSIDESCCSHPLFPLFLLLFLCEPGFRQS
jgi:hypothetical protein